MGDTFAVPLQNISKAGRKAKVVEIAHVMNLLLPASSRRQPGAVSW